MTSGVAASRRTWSTRSFRALDFSFAIDAAEPSVCVYLDRVMAPLVADDRPAAHRYSLFADADERWVVRLDDRELEVSRTPAEALAHLLWHVNRSVVIRSAGYVLLHAAVASLDGRAVLLPAPSGAGKTTLVAGLVLSGMAYLSDEIAAIDPATGLVHPYAKPLTIHRGSFGTLAPMAPEHPPETGNWVAGQWHVAPTDIRSGAVGLPCRPAAVIVPHYSPDRPTELRSLPRAEALRLLVESCFNLEIHGAHGLHVLARALRGAECYRISVRELDGACELVHRVLDGRVTEAEETA